MTLEELNNVQGRAWEDVDVSLEDAGQHGRKPTLTTLYSIERCFQLTSHANVHQ